MSFGFLIVWEVSRYIANGWIQQYWLAPKFHFTYFGFGWVRPLPSLWMYVMFVVLGVAAVGVAAGVVYRLSAFTLWLLFTYQFLLEQARYLNHFYAASLFAFILVIIPASRAWSFGGERRQDPRWQGAVPWWTVLLLRFQVGVIYAFAGVAKINGDWLQGSPIDQWMLRLSDRAVPAFFIEHGLEQHIAVASLLFDLAIVPALLYRRTRFVAFAGACAFHVMNAFMFDIGIFPWMTIAATTIFFDPGWARALASRFISEQTADVPRASWPMSSLGRIPATFLLLFVLVQLAMPLRHLIYPGNVAWTEEGHRLSWRMMLREKKGTAAFRVETTAGTHAVDLRTHLTSWQIASMSTRPDMIHQFAVYLAELYGTQGSSRPRVYVEALASLHGRPPAYLIDPTTDLASEKRQLWPPAPWIRPNAQPLGNKLAVGQ